MINVSPYKIRLLTSGSTIEDKYIALPVGNAFDGVGQNELIEDYVVALADEAINPIVDYEQMRYTPVVTSGGTITDEVKYDFYFFNDDAIKVLDKTTESFQDGSKTSNFIVDFMIMLSSGITTEPNFHFMTQSPTFPNTADPPLPWRNISNNWDMVYSFINNFGVTVDITLDFEFTNILFIERAYVWAGSGALGACNHPIPQPTSNMFNFLNDGPTAVNNPATLVTIGYHKGSVTYNQNGITTAPGEPNLSNYNVNMSFDGGVYDDPNSGNALYVRGRYITIEGKATFHDVSPGEAVEIYLRQIPDYPADPYGGSPIHCNWQNTYFSNGKVTTQGTQKYSLSYGTDYVYANIPQVSYNNDFKGYTQSFFRLDFFDSVLEETQNLLFTDIITVNESAVVTSSSGVPSSLAEFTTLMNKQNYFLYWLKNDPTIQENGYRDVWMNAKFFNATTGQVLQFMNANGMLGQEPTIDQYQTLLKYTKIRIYKDYTYMICERKVTAPTMIAPGVPGPPAWQVTDSDSIGIDHLSLQQVRVIA